MVELEQRLGNELLKISKKYFKDEIFLTLIARKPDNDEADLAISDDTPSQVKKAVERLPDGYRVIFTLYLLEGYDHVEISEILGISESTSKSQYMRARHKVKELLLMN